LIKRDYLGNTLLRKQYYEYNPNFNADVHIIDKATRVLLVDAGNKILSERKDGEPRNFFCAASSSFNTSTNSTGTFNPSARNADRRLSNPACQDGQPSK